MVALNHCDAHAVDPHRTELDREIGLEAEVLSGLLDLSCEEQQKLLRLFLPGELRVRKWRRLFEVAVGELQQTGRLNRDSFAKALRGAELFHRLPQSFWKQSRDRAKTYDATLRLVREIVRAQALEAVRELEAAIMEDRPMLNSLHSTGSFLQSCNNRLEKSFRLLLPLPK